MTNLINPIIRAELAQAVFNWRNSHQIPTELAAARAAVTNAWNEYQVVVDRDHTPAEWDAAYAKANKAELEHREWFDRWQALGGTSDIRSIVEAEAVTIRVDTMRRVMVQV